MVSKHRVLAGVLDDEGNPLACRVLAKRMAQGRFAAGGPRLFQSVRALEELPVLVEQADEGDRRGQQAGRKARETFEGSLRCRV
jgi:hypothetical protein